MATLLPPIPMKVENTSILNFESRLKTLEQQFYLPVNDLEELPFKIELKTVEDVRKFDHYLSDYEYMSKVKKSMEFLGGANLKKTYRNMFNQLFPSALLAQFSWRGTAKKAKFQELLNIKKCISTAVLKRFSNATLLDYDNFCKDFVRFAKYRK